MINLQKPLAFFDLETTGLDVTNDRIIEIGILKMNPDGSQESYQKRVNPEMKISPESAEITGITDADVKDCPTFKELAAEIAAFIGDADLAGYNSNKFDIPVLAEEFLRAESDFDMSARRAVDVQNIFHKMEQRTLSAAMKFYCNKELENAHRAMADVNATFEILEAQLERYPELENNTKFLSEFATIGSKTLDFARRIGLDDYDNAIFNFGKYKGTPVIEIFKKDKGYYNWIMNGDFAKDTKNHFTKLFNQVNK
jgi:DNA polymerase-3 subunit epsilon